MTKSKEHYSAEGVRQVECCRCHSLVLMATSGKFRGNYYCNPCYLKRMEEQISDWKIDYKRARNNKSWDEVKNHLPILSQYIN